MPEKGTSSGIRPSALAKLSAATIVATIQLGSGPACAFDCEALLKVHGLLRRASVACGFKAYNETIVERAHTCFDEVGRERGVADIRAGAGEFDRMDTVRNRDALCLDLGRRFSMVVR